MSVLIITLHDLIKHVENTPINLDENQSILDFKNHIHDICEEKIFKEIEDNLLNKENIDRLFVSAMLKRHTNQYTQLDYENANTQGLEGEDELF